MILNHNIIYIYIYKATIPSKIIHQNRLVSKYYVLIDKSKWYLKHFFFFLETESISNQGLKLMIKDYMK